MWNFHKSFYFAAENFICYQISKMLISFLFESAGDAYIISYDPWIQNQINTQSSVIIKEGNDETQEEFEYLQKLNLNGITNKNKVSNLTRD